MRKTRLFKLSLLTMTLCGSLFSENKILAQEKTSKSIPLNVSATDERFYVDNTTFFKRLEKSSATLNVAFELHNKTDRDIKLKVVLIAFRRVDGIDKTLRRVIQYPAWRKRDLDKEKGKNLNLDSIPAIDKNLVDESLKSSNEYPDFQKYLNYIGSNSAGVEILLKGLNTPPVETTGIKEISVISEPMKTSIFGKLKVPFNHGNEFFNQFGIILVDTEQKKIVSSELYYFDAPFTTH